MTSSSYSRRSQPPCNVESMIPTLPFTNAMSTGHPLRSVVVFKKNQEVGQGSIPSSRVMVPSPRLVPLIASHSYHVVALDATLCCPSMCPLSASVVYHLLYSSTDPVRCWLAGGASCASGSSGCVLFFLLGGVDGQRVGRGDGGRSVAWRTMLCCTRWAARWIGAVRLLGT